MVMVALALVTALALAAWGGCGAAVAGLWAGRLVAAMAAGAVWVAMAPAMAMVSMAAVVIPCGIAYPYC